MIRPYETDDREELLEVWYRASRLAHGFLSEDLLTTERHEIATRWLPIADTIVYEVGGRVVGFLALIGNEVGAIFVDPDRHGTGIGRALMDHARDTRPFLEVDVFEANTIGRRLYDAYGFELLHEHVDPASTHHMLRLRLDAAR